MYAVPFASVRLRRHKIAHPGLVCPFALSAPSSGSETPTCNIIITNFHLLHHHQTGNVELCRLSAASITVYKSSRPELINNAAREGWGQTAAAVVDDGYRK